MIRASIKKIQKNMNSKTSETKKNIEWKQKISPR